MFLSVKGSNLESTKERKGSDRQEINKENMATAAAAALAAAAVKSKVRLSSLNNRDSERFH